MATGAECAVIAGTIEMLLLPAANLDCPLMVYNYTVAMIIVFSNYMYKIKGEQVAKLVKISYSWYTVLSILQELLHSVILACMHLMIHQ